MLFVVLGVIASLRREGAARDRPFKELLQQSIMMQKGRQLDMTKGEGKLNDESKQG